MTSPARTDYSREESLRILGPATIAEIDRLAAEAPAPTPKQVQALQRIFALIDADIAREDVGDSPVAA